MMKVLLLTSHLDLGGIPRYVINLAKSLKSLGERVWVASAGGSWQEELRANGIEHLCLPIRTKSIVSPKVLSSFSVVDRFLKTQPVDIIHASTRVTQALGCLIYKRRGIPYVSTFHGCYRPHLVRRLFSFEGLRTIAVSNFVKTHAVERLKLDQDRVSVVYNGMDIAACLKKAQGCEFASIKNSLKVSPLIGTVSRLTPEKNVDALVAAMPRLIQRFPDIRLVILGEGRSEAGLKQKVEGLGLKERVIFLKGIHPCSFLQDLDVFISLSKGEPFGFSVIEAQLLKVPVIALASGAHCETVQNGLSGILVENTSPQVLSQALRSVLENGHLRQSLIDAAVKNVEQRFSSLTMAEGTRLVYQEAIKR
jgi:glycosyltransferase involved in cell wall biosynthesis